MATVVKEKITSVVQLDRTVAVVVAGTQGPPGRDGVDGATSQVTIVADMAARDALATEAETNLMVLVLDATADETVDAGSALYAYDLATDDWYKVAEYESMDVVVTWADISGKPTSSASQIDDAVTKAHQHTNKPVLDKLTESAEGDLLFDGDPVRSQWDAKDW